MTADRNHTVVVAPERTAGAQAPGCRGRAPMLGRLARQRALPGAFLLLLASATAFAQEAGRSATDRLPPGVELDSAIVPAIANWVVLGATGTASWRPQGERGWRSFEAGQVLVAGSEISTGPDGEVTLVAGGDRLIVAADGRVVVPQTGGGEDRRILQRHGHILMEIEPLGRRDVRVTTPLLSLGIKGTTFEVLVDDEQNSVAVHDGEVTVTTRGAPAPVELRTGEGLRQPVARSARSAQFELPDLEPAPDRTDAPVWFLPFRIGEAAAAQTDNRATETDERKAEAAAAERRSTRPSQLGQTTRERRAPQAEGWASPWVLLAIAGVIMLILRNPALALVQSLRQQWRSQSTTEGKTRREPKRNW